MQFEITTSEAAELFGVTRKTIAEWAKPSHRVMEKASHGRLKLKESLENYLLYQDALRDCGSGERALDRFWVLRDARDFAREQAQRYANSRPEDLTGLPELGELQKIEITKDEHGNIIKAMLVNKDGSLSPISESDEPPP